MSVEYLFNIVLNSVVFSLFRSETLEGAEERFLIYKDKVPVLVQIVREVAVSFYSEHVCIKLNLFKYILNLNRNKFCF